MTMADAPVSTSSSTLWRVEIKPAEGRVDRAAHELIQDAIDLGIFPAGTDAACCQTARGFLIQGELDQHAIQDLCRELLVDPVVESVSCSQQSAVTGDAAQSRAEPAESHVFYVLPKPGVTDAAAETALSAIQDLGHAAQAVQTFRKFEFTGISQEHLDQLVGRLLANDSIERVLRGSLNLLNLQSGVDYDFQLQTVPLRELSADELLETSRQGQLSLTRVEMQSIQQHFRQLDRDPTDAELETIAQTWSEHCSHKTLAGKIHYRDGDRERRFENMLKETVFAATQEIRRRLAESDWCVSVFKDNAGVVQFVDDFHLCFKVETHNRPSAIEPYGGANTGIGGVIRDTLGTGLGARPICNTDVFCFASPDTPVAELPPGVMHPRRIMKGVVAGVRDYGNRMGIPTVNGAVYFDPRYVGNPLVFCGNVGLIRSDRVEKAPRDGDLIVAIGGRTGRDGIHGATFSSAELTDQSEKQSGGAVQIGNAITEKTVLDVLLKASDEGLFQAVTDCGAGGFSSAVGEMAEGLGATVHLEQAPLKYAGLSYVEIWISEAQERMVCAVSPENWQRVQEICQQQDVDATCIGKFEATGRLRLLYREQEVADLDLEFLHDGRPPVVRDAVFERPPIQPLDLPAFDANQLLRQILAAPNVASKHWIIRQYDHEVQAGSVVKPLVGKFHDGPGDAAVIQPIVGRGRRQVADSEPQQFSTSDSFLRLERAVVLSCGMNPYFGDHDPYALAASGIDEAIRNCVAVGADPDRIAILDNFCWGYTDRPSTLGKLVRAAEGCHDTAVAMGTPFISGKDSLNNEFSYARDGESHTISIPSTLLISAMGQMPDATRAVTMDFKAAGNPVYLIGVTRPELGGSHLALQFAQQDKGTVPGLDTALALELYRKLHAAINQRLVAACHDLSEGGLAVALAEMCFAGGLGAEIRLAAVEIQGGENNSAESGVAEDCVKLFSESNSRLLVEVRSGLEPQFETFFAGLPVARIGVTSDSNELQILATAGEQNVVCAGIDELKQAWQATLDWS